MMGPTDEMAELHQLAETAHHALPLAAWLHTLACAFAAPTALVILSCALGLVPAKAVVALDAIGAASPSRLVRVLLCSPIGMAWRGAERGSRFCQHWQASMLRNPSFVHAMPNAVALCGLAALAFYLCGRVCQ